MDVSKEGVRHVNAVSNMLSIAHLNAKPCVTMIDVCVTEGIMCGVFNPRPVSV
jgi:hypothetical protein